MWKEVRTDVITLTMVIITLAIACIMALMPRPIAEKIDPYKTVVSIVSCLFKDGKHTMLYSLS